MPWVRIDDGFTGNAKVSQLTDAEFRVWMRVLCHCGRCQDPSVDRVAMNEVAGLTKARVKRFAALGLIDAVGDAWEVHDWEKYQPRDSTNAERQARWRARRTVTQTVTETVTPTVTSLARAPVPVPSRPLNTPAKGFFHEAGWNDKQQRAALTDEPRARACVKWAREQTDTESVAARSWDKFKTGEWPPKTIPNSRMPQEPPTCDSCGNLVRDGHTATCPVGLETSRVLEELA